MAKIDLGDSMEDSGPVSVGKGKREKWYPGIIVPEDLGIKPGGSFTATCELKVTAVEISRAEGRKERRETRCDVISISVSDAGDGGRSAGKKEAANRFAKIDGTT